MHLKNVQNFNVRVAFLDQIHLTFSLWLLTILLLLTQLPSFNFEPVYNDRNTAKLASFKTALKMGKIIKTFLVHCKLGKFLSQRFFSER